MKSFTVIVFFVFWIIVIYFGWIYLTGKVMKSQPKVDSSVSMQQQRYLRKEAEETRESQKQLMLDRQQRLKDMQRR